MGPRRKATHSNTLPVDDVVLEALETHLQEHVIAEAASRNALRGMLGLGRKVSEKSFEIALRALDGKGKIHCFIDPSGAVSVDLPDSCALAIVSALRRSEQAGTIEAEDYIDLRAKLRLADQFGVRELRASLRELQRVDRITYEIGPGSIVLSMTS